MTENSGALACTLECENLTKSYSKNGPPVLKDMSFSLSSGRIVGLLGPNGCGKSTLIKLITGLLTPDSGRIKICGEDISYKTNRYVSYLPERTYFDPSMTVSELLAFFADFYDDFDTDTAVKMLEELKISKASRLRTLSKGNKEKVQLIMVMSRRAKLYLLDEPIAGVDPAARDYILRTIISNHNPEATVVITTHLIHDIEKVLDEFCFMGYSGHILMAGVADEVRAEHGKSLDELFREVFRCY